MRILVTGGAGFIGSHLVDYLITIGHEVTVLDSLSVGGSRMNLHQHQDIQFVLADVNDEDLVMKYVRDADVVIHAAAESHVDRSIDAGKVFIKSNVMGTQTVLDAVRSFDTRLLMISTDEVYGPGRRGGGTFDEEAPLRPRSPYAASKAAADLLCQAHVNTYGLDITIVRGTNAYGPRQIERVVPTFAINAIRDQPIPLYGAGTQRREFLHVYDWVRGVLAVLDKGQSGLVYNIGGGHELTNFELAIRIVRLVGASEKLIELVPDRPGHDFRYGIEANRLKLLGWQPEISFDTGLYNTVHWYMDNLDWLNKAHQVGLVTVQK